MNDRHRESELFLSRSDMRTDGPALHGRQPTANTNSVRIRLDVDSYCTGLNQSMSHHTTINSFNGTRIFSSPSLFRGHIAGRERRETPH
jgi:hypothetical protein